MNAINDNDDHAVAGAYRKVMAAKKNVERLNTSRQDMVINLTKLVSIDPSTIILGDHGTLRGVRKGDTGQHFASDVIDFPSHTELKELLTELREAEKELATTEGELGQLTEQDSLEELILPI